MDLVGIELADLDELLHFGDGHLAAGGDHRVEVARGLAEDQVPGLVALPRFDDREIRVDRLLQDVFPAAEPSGLFARSEIRAERRARVETWNAGAPRAQLFGEGALRRELELELAREDLTLELL